MCQNAKLEAGAVLFNLVSQIYMRQRGVLLFSAIIP